MTLRYLWLLIAVARQFDNVETARCSSSTLNPHHVNFGDPCPHECPYSQPLEGGSCEKVCVKESICGMFHPVRSYADPWSFQCAPPCGTDAHITGCASCATRGLCKRCARGLFGMSWLALSDDGTRCENNAATIFRAFYTLIVGLALFVIGYVVHLISRSVVNSKVLRESFQHRQSLKLPHVRDWLTANVHRTDIAGKGVALYFNSLCFVMLVSVMLCCVVFTAYEHSDYARQLKLAPQCNLVQIPMPDILWGGSRAREGKKGEHSSERPKRNRTTFYRITQHKRHLVLRSSPNYAAPVRRLHEIGVEGNVSINTEENDGSPMDRFLTAYRKIWDPVFQAPRTKGLKAKYLQFHHRMAYACLILYFVVVVVSWMFQAWQLDRVGEFGDSGGSDYCLKVYNIPLGIADGRIITAHFRQCLEESKDAETVIGTSLAYDYYGSEREVSTAIDEWLDDLRLEASCQSQHSGVRGLDKMVMTDKRNDIIFYALTPEYKAHKWRHMTDTRLSSFGITAWILSPGIWLLDNLAMRFVGLNDVKPDLFVGSGSAYVIFQTVDACLRMREKLERGEIALQHREEMHILRCQTHTPDPCDVYWMHHTSWSHFWHKIIFGILLMIGVILVWVLMYVPYALYYVNFMNVPGVSPSSTQDMLLGFLIGIANVLLAVVIQKVTSWAGFSSKANRDIAILSLAFAGSFLNTVFDLIMVAHLAKGAALDAAFLGESTGYDTHVANELYGMIVPGYLILPYFTVPIFEHLLPYWLATWLIRSRLTIYVREGQKSIRCPEFDICWRYADILNNTTVCLILMFFVSSNSWRVMLWLLGFLLIVYVIDRFLLLRCTTATYYTSNRLDIAFTYWWCAPTAILALASVFWGHKAYHFPLMPASVFCVVTHTIVYCSMVALMTRYASRPKANRLSFAEANRERRVGGKTWGYFNTNPIFCLRTRYLGAEASGWAEIRENLGMTDDECVPFQPGKGFDDKL